MIPGALNLITDVAGLVVGNAQDAALRSGTTVLTAAAPFACSCAILGGAPGTRETDLLEPDKSVPGVDALVLSGGSAFGLAAAQGVMDALHDRGRGFAIYDARVPLVPAAILFDLLNGGDKAWPDNPYPALGTGGAGRGAGRVSRSAAPEPGPGRRPHDTRAGSARLRWSLRAASPSARWWRSIRWAA